MYASLLKGLGVDVFAVSSDGCLVVSRCGIVWNFTCEDGIYEGSHEALDPPGTGVMFVCTTANSAVELVESLVESVQIYRDDK